VSWCDKLASTPVVGLRFGVSHQSSDKLLDALQPLFDTWVEGRKQQFSIDRQTSFGIQFTTEGGFNYTVDYEGVVVDYRHRFRIKPRSGGQPVAELLSKARPYTQLLDEAIERVLEAVDLVNGPRARPIWRLGIMSTTAVVLSDAPPGIRRLVDYIGKPWGGKLAQYNFEITGLLKKENEYSDRCIHSVGMGDVENNPDNLVSIKLDWQRSYSISRPLAVDAIKKHVAAGKKAALEYFEDVAEGSRFDEAILNKSA
jgi:hypothetical protein